MGMRLMVKHAGLTLSGPFLRMDNAEDFASKEKEGAIVIHQVGPGCTNPKCSNDTLWVENLKVSQCPNCGQTIDLRLKRKTDK